jgi:hypothetical protein
MRDIDHFILGHFPLRAGTGEGSRVDNGEAKVRDGQPISAKSGGIREIWNRLRKYPKVVHSPPALISIFSNSLELARLDLVDLTVSCLPTTEKSPYLNI